MARKGDDGIGPKTALVEFKVQETLIYADSFLRRIKTDYQRRKRSEDPELTEKPQIFQVEKDALDIYTKIAEKLGVVVIVIGWQKPTDRLIAQYAEKIIVCNEWVPSKEKRDTGSGTIIYNTHIDSYERLDVFCSRVFGLQDYVLDAIRRSIRR